MQSPLPISEVAPCWIHCLLLDQGHEVELRVEAIGLGTRVGQEPVLVQLLCNLIAASVRVGGLAEYLCLRRALSWDSCAVDEIQPSAGRQWSTGEAS